MLDSVTIEYAICDPSGQPLGYVRVKDDPAMYVQPSWQRPAEWAVIKRKVTVEQALAAGILR